MKTYLKITKLKILGLIIITLFSINTYFSFYPNYFIKNKPKISTTYPDIEINDFPGSLNDWDWARTQPWCTQGLGTEASPYIIDYEDFTYISGSTGNCLLIENSRAYFRIEGCTFLNSKSGSAGLRLNNVSNAEIKWSYFYNNSNGIHLSNCSNNIIWYYNEIFENDNYGIYISDLSKNNIIALNSIYNNSDSGIRVSNSDECYIEWNSINENLINGIYFYYSKYNYVYGNTINENENGIDSLMSPHNNFSKNTIRYNNFYGIHLQNNCDNNSFYDNSVDRNYYAFYLSDCDNISITKGSENVNEYGGIFSWNCDNIKISGSSINRNIRAIIISSSENNSIVSNVVKDNKEGGITLANCFDNSILNNVVNNSRYGINLQNCNVTNLLENNINNNEYDGIHIDECNNTIINANKINNNSEGINLHSYHMTSHDINISNNTIYNNKMRGIMIYGLNNSTISSNTLYNNSFMGIEIEWSLDNILYDNKMYYCGLDVYGPRKYMLSNEINTSNTVNNKPLYLYKKENGLTYDNFSNAGQIILINCNNSKITNVDLSYGSRGVQLYQCENNTLSNFNASYNSRQGVYLRYGNDNLITGINTSYNYRGIFLEASNTNNITNIVADYNEETGIYFDYGCDYNNISKNNLSYNGLAGIYMYGGDYNNFTDNLMIHCGLRIQISLGDLTTFSSNLIDQSNKVNGKNLYIYISKNNLDVDDFTDAGQIILINCNDSLISGLSIPYSTTGVHLFHCKNNQIIFSNFSNNLEAGIEIQRCNNISVFGNIIKNNKINGIHMSDSLNNKITNCSLKKEFFVEYQAAIYIEGSCDDNIIYHNTVYGTGFDGGSNNIWDDGEIGNFWDDYTGVDLDKDGIGDSYYTLPGYTKANDTKPLMYPLDIDTDGDGLINYEEYLLGDDNYRTNVTNPDTDYDELSDYWEWLNSTDPTNPDTDSDNMPDGWEVFNMLNPLVNDALDDIDDDGLENIYEYLNGTDPNNNDTDGDSFLDGVEVNPSNDWRTDPLNRWWYPMPNLAIEKFEIASAEIGKPFVLNITIVNNGIWRAEDIVIIIWIPLLNKTLYNNSNNPIDLEVDESYQKLIQVTEIWKGGDLLVELILDPNNLINETYSSKDGSFREYNEKDNTKETVLTIGGGQQTPWNPLWTIFIIIGVVGIVGIPSSALLLRPRMKRKAILKRQIETAKTDIKNFETIIRRFIKSKLFATYGKQWWDKGIPIHIRNTINKKLAAEKPKKSELSIDKMEFLDFTHYNTIITSEENWENIFSPIFPDKNTMDTNFENLRVFKRELFEGSATSADLNNYSLFIFAISNCITEGFNIFLSYSTKDAEYFNIKEVASRLESYPKIDKALYWEVDSGEDIVDYMERTLRISRVFILFCSENSIKSKAVEDEWHSAFQVRKEGKIKIVPVYEKEENIPYLLKPLLNVRFNKDNFEEFIRNLYEEILR